jgi:hypothetical protein
VPGTGTSGVIPKTIGRTGGSAFLLKTLQAKEAERDSIVESLAHYSTRALSSVDPNWLGPESDLNWRISESVEHGSAESQG